MGKVDHPYGFTGKVGTMVFYKRAMSSDIIVRQAKGIPRNRILNDHHYVNFRKHSEEFKAKNMLGKIIYQSFKDINPVFDHIFYNRIISMLSKVQNLENRNNTGQREIWFSQFGSMFEGLSFNTRSSWDQFVRSPAGIQIDQEKRIVNISIPGLLPGEGFNNAIELPYCRFLFVLTVVPDIVRTTIGYKPSIETFAPNTVSTAWLPTDHILPATQLQLAIPEIQGQPYSLMISSAISFGKMFNGKVGAVKYVGAGSIVKVVKGGG